MHFRVIRVKRGRSEYRYAQIVERVYENGKPKNRLLKHLGPVYGDSDIERYRKTSLLEKRKGEIEHANLEDLDILPPLEFGVTYASRMLMDDLGILQIFPEYLGANADVAVIMVTSRMFDTSSDYALLRTLERIYYPWSGTAMKKDRLYRTLDRLEKNKESIELDIFNRLKPDVSVVHYDLTSSFFEGREDNDLMLFGYSRDRKRGKEQIVIGLVMADGIPIYHEVWPGNTVDPKTLESIISVLKERFSIKNVILIADRAFARSPSLKLLDRNLYITAVYR